MPGTLKITGGRTRRLWPELVSELDSTYRKGIHCIVIVPEHYTLRCERDILSALSIPGFFDIEVLSPSRLAYRVFELAGTDGRLQIDKRGQSIALARALTECRRELRYYKRATDKTGFVEHAGKLIADLKAASISPEYLAAQAEGVEDELLREKLKDICAIFSAYENQLKGRFVDGDDISDMAARRIAPSGIADAAFVFVYGFDLLTNDFRRMLLEICKNAASTIVYLDMDKENAQDGDCFLPVRDSAYKLLEAVNTGGDSGCIIWLNPSPIKAPPELRYLEQSLMLSLPAAFQEPPDAIRLYAAPTLFAEAHYIAQQIVMEHKRGISYEDICVVTSSLPAYEGVVSAVLNDYGIPAYFARKRPLLSNGAVRFLLAALRSVSGSYRLEDMVAVMKSGFSPLNETECWLLENYAIAWGIKGKRWLEPFLHGEVDRRGTVEQAREKLIFPFEKLRKAMRAARSADQSISAIYQLLEDVSAYDCLVAQISELSKAGYESQAVITRQVWDLVMSLLDQLHELMQGGRVPARYAAAWLEAGLRASEISSLPPVNDCVLCAEIGNVALSEPRVLFFIGMNDGPQELPGNWLLGDDEITETEHATGKHFTLGLENHEALARLQLWKTLSAPQNRLYLSYSLAKQDGTVLRPDKQISHMKHMFPLLMEEGGINAAPGAMFPLAPVPALDTIAVKLRLHALEGDWAEAWKWLHAAPAWKERSNMLVSALRPPLPSVNLPRALAESLFSERVVSVSRLEKYARCPYNHFIQYGLKPKPRATWGIDASSTGDFYHAAMEGFTHLLPTVTDWPHITRQTCDDMMDHALEPVREKWKDGPMGESVRLQTQGKRYINICKRIAWIMTRGAQRSSFRPSDAEVRFGYEDGGLPPLLLAMPDGSQVYVRGIIDRIDRYEGDYGLYMRVVDYKSDNRTLRAERIWWGIQLQLLLYLEAALHASPGAEPAGVFYQHMDDPLVDGSERNKDGDADVDGADINVDFVPDEEAVDKIENIIARRLLLQGIALRDVRILKLMDGYDPPLTILNMLNKNGEPARNKPLMTLDQLKALIAHAHRKAVEITTLIRSGDISVHPVAYDTSKVECNYCGFEGVCRKDRITGYGSGWKVAAMDYEELLGKITETHAGEN